MKKFYLTRDEKKAIPFILPGVAVTALLIIYPLFYIISMSFSENAIGQSGFAGLTNYLRLFKIQCLHLRYGIRWCGHWEQ